MMGTTGKGRGSVGVASWRTPALRGTAIRTTKALVKARAAGGVRSVRRRSRPADARCGMALLEGVSRARRPRHGQVLSSSERRWPWLLWALVVLLHGVFFAFIVQQMQPRPRAVVMSVDQGAALQIRLISRPSAAPPPLPDLLAPLHPTREGHQPMPKKVPVKPVRDTPRADALSAHIQAPAAAASSPTPTLYDKRGQVVMPPTRSAPPTTPNVVQHALKGDTQIMQHTTPIDKRTTRFEKYFPPPGETAGGAALRHVVEAVVGQTTVNLPAGTHLKCRTLLGVPTPDCHEPPPPPPPTDGDERLNMAPPPLAADPHAKPPPTVKSCIADYRAGTPLPYGCPVDTPTRAVDAKINECVALYRAGKRLKTWCPADTAKRAAAADPAPASSAPPG